MEACGIRQNEMNV